MAGQETNRYRLRDGRDILIRPARVEDAEQLLNHARIIMAEDLYNITTLEEFKQTVEEERKWISKRAAIYRSLSLCSQFREADQVYGRALSFLIYDLEYTVCF